MVYICKIVLNHPAFVSNSIALLFRWDALDSFVDISFHNRL